VVQERHRGLAGTGVDAESLRRRIESFGQSTYGDPLQMTNFILNKKSVAPANGRRCEATRAVHCANGRPITIFKASTYQVLASW
jgi:hypothetical protein